MRLWPAGSCNKRLVEMTNEELYVLGPPHRSTRTYCFSREKERRRRRAIEDNRDEAREFHDATETSDWAKWIPWSCSRNSDVGSAGIPEAISSAPDQLKEPS